LKLKLVFPCATQEIPALDVSQRAILFSAYEIGNLKMSELYKVLHFPTRLISTRARTHKTKRNEYIYAAAAAATFHFSDYIRFSSRLTRFNFARLDWRTMFARCETYERYEFAESNI
jgi:hypothetical protein